jgi:hypothetical protein
VGNLTLYVSAKLNGVSKQSLPVNITVLPPNHLASVSVSPRSDTLAPNGMASFTAYPVCSSPATCPLGVTYQWSINRPAMGNLNSTVANPVAFTAGTTIGTLALFVNATLNGVTAMGAPTVITIATNVSTLMSVSLAPPTASVVTGGTTPSITASPSCSATCPAGTTYSWTLSPSSLGHLNGTTSNPVVFTAGSATGVVRLYVNATLNSLKVMSAPAVITINPSTPQLVSVTVSPAAATVTEGSSQVFSATPTCTGACPSGTTYSWSLSGSAYGTFNTTSGESVSFTAADVLGTVNLFVNATLNGVTEPSSAVPITIVSAAQEITSVSISPISPSVQTNATLTFTATPSCTAGACPSGTIYSWSLTSDLGALNASTGPIVFFTAGMAAGEVTLFVNATLGDRTVNASVTITITSQFAGTSPSFFSSGTFLWLLIIVVAVAVVAIVVVIVARRKRNKPAVTGPVQPWQPGGAVAPPTGGPPPPAPPWQEEP